MSLAKAARERIKLDMLKQINQIALDVNKTAAKYQVSRQTIYRYLRELQAQGIITQEAPRQYRFATRTWEKCYENQGLAEDDVWRQDIAPLCKGIPKQARERVQYVFTAVLNNALEHSESVLTNIIITKTPIYLTMFVIDTGIGLFKKLQYALRLPEKSFAPLELAKGKITTDPHGHSGQGIFFCSRIADDFAIYADGLAFFLRGGKNDVLKDDIGIAKGGTAVGATILFDSAIDIREVFHNYTGNPGSSGFNATQIPVKLLDYGVSEPVFVSRAEARRLLARAERFDKLTLDFAGVADIREAFADELFRVFPSKHGECKLEAINCNERVQEMMEHIKNTK